MDTDRGGIGSGFCRREYSAGQVVLVGCSHVREMKGETDEVLRRTRSDGAESAVVNAVRRCGAEPDWFVERWVEDRDELVACAVFEKEKEGYAERFADEIAKMRCEADAKGEECDVRIVDDDAMREGIARYFTEEWERRRKEQMARYADVVGDARSGGKYSGLVVVGEYAADGEDARKAFEDVAAGLNDAFPHDGFGEGGIVYSGFWDEGNVARFCFGFPDAKAMMAAQDALDGIGARFYDPLTDDGVEGVELEMTALVIAKMQGEEKAKAERARMAEELAAKMGKAADGVGAMDAAEAERRFA